ncbi:sulfur carrier protein ThiS [Marinobacter caseinilyticus]|uniref:sulfur carrier protein ThiS n=1 Tax=Marinobacter caseinilyticus TaxID=2692195 RepID=UPI00140ABF52|nr:sulfur carrier protein ThiS [Marinobacter caseinilyticus]
MKIQVNGAVAEVPVDATVAVLLDQLAITGKRLAVEVNEDIVPRSQHGSRKLHPGDRVEVVHAIGGG